MLQGIQQKTCEYRLTPYVKSDPARMVPIAPAPERKYLTLDLPSDKKYNYKSSGCTGAQTASIARRNARERNRVKQVNDGFNALRKRLPAAVVAALSGGARRGSGKKLSKVDTLKMVVEYIKYLQSLIDESYATPRMTRITPAMESLPYEVDEGIFDRSSPYSESVPSPTGSECSSGVSSARSMRGYVHNYHSEEQITPMDDDELLNAISWWQHK